MNQQLQSPLFRLPPEIRDTIWTYALTSSDPIEDLIVKKTPVSILIPPALGRDLLRTCKRINREIDLRFFFTQNRFKFTSPSFAHEFLCDLRRRAGKAELITELVFDMREALQPPPVSQNANAGLNGNPPLDFMRSSPFVEWQHYLICAIPIQDRESTSPCAVARREYTDPLCELNEDAHFLDDLCGFSGLRVLVLDFVGLQKKFRKGGVESPIAFIVHKFLDLLFFFLTTTTTPTMSGVEVRIRMLNSWDKAVEGTISAAPTDLAVVKGGANSSSVWEWTRQRLLETLHGIHSNVQVSVTSS